MPVRLTPTESDESDEETPLELQAQGTKMKLKDRADEPEKYFCVVSTAPAEKQWCDDAPPRQQSSCVCHPIVALI